MDRKRSAGPEHGVARAGAGVSDPLEDCAFSAVLRQELKFEGPGPVRRHARDFFESVADDVFGVAATRVGPAVASRGVDDRALAANERAVAGVNERIVVDRPFGRDPADRKRLSDHAGLEIEIAQVATWESTGDRN